MVILPKNEMRGEITEWYFNWTLSIDDRLDLCISSNEYTKLYINKIYKKTGIITRCSLNVYNLNPHCIIFLFQLSCITWISRLYRELTFWKSLPNTQPTLKRRNNCSPWLQLPLRAENFTRLVLNNKLQRGSEYRTSSNSKSVFNCQMLQIKMVFKFLY